MVSPKKDTHLKLNITLKVLKFRVICGYKLFNDLKL